MAQLAEGDGGMKTLCLLSTLSGCDFCPYYLTGPTLRSGTAALDLGDLEQVLLDEELARRLQEEEERLAEEVNYKTKYIYRSFGIFHLHFNQAHLI